MSNININNDYTKMNNLTPFKLCVLQNFPFIEADFDAVTNYQLLCKVVEYLNNVIDNNNKQNTNIAQLEQNFITLYNYVKDYFDNLDVQEEINKKLDEMAADGSLSKLIQPLFDEYKKTIDSEVNTQNDKIVVLENRMNTFASLPSGSTSGDAELIDIRVPASGFNSNKNYATAGDSVRGQVNTLEKEIYDINSISKNFFADLKNKGTYFNWAIKAFENNVNYNTSDIIKVKKGYSIYINSYYDAAYISVVNQVAENGDFIKVLVKGVSNSELTTKYTFREDMYIQVCVRTNGYFYLYENLSNEIEEINKSLGIQIDSDLIEKSPNLFNFLKTSAKGFWCNYTNGKFESNEYVNYYCYSDYIEVEANTEYYRKLGQRGSVFFDKNKEYISGVQTNTFTTPQNCKYVVINVDYDNRSSFALNKGSKQLAYNYYYDFKYRYPYDDCILIGTNTEHENILDGFNEANKRGLGVIISPGIYDISADLATTSIGLLMPKKVCGYGVTLIGRLESQSADISVLNCSTELKKTELYGITVISKNTRYTLHDEMGGSTLDGYYHLIKDVHFINESLGDSTWTTPNNVGGGLGNNGYVDIVNSIFEQTGGFNKNIDYHSRFTGEQTVDSIVKIRDSYIDKNVTVTPIGTSTDFKNTMYISNNNIGKSVSSYENGNVKMIAWNNAVI